MTQREATMAFAALVMCLLGVTPAFAQQATSTIAGRVTDVTTGVPIAGAFVSLEATVLRSLADSAGNFRLPGVPAGPQVLRVTRLGYAPLRRHVVVSSEGTLMVDIAMARHALQLPGLVVVDDPASRARGELGTASVISEEAIRNQTAASLAGILELVPGTLLQPPGLDGVQQFALRAVPIGPGGPASAGSAYGASASALASFGTQVIVDGVPVSNNANLQDLGVRGELSFATAAGGGIDLRRIPAATVERVEIIRGIPSSRFGDLTQGVVLVDTRAGAVEPELRVRADARTVESTVIGGRSFSPLQTATASINVARTRAAAALRDNTSSRISGQLAHRLELNGGVTLDSRVDGFQVLQDVPPTPTFPDIASRSRDNGFRVSERLRWPFGARRSVDWTVAFEGVRQRSFTQAPRLRGAMPFTNRLTEGTQDGKFVGGVYVARVDVEGDPRQLYSRVEGRLPGRRFGLQHDARAGLELRREWNGGPGYLFDIEFPPQVEFNGVNGYDRPRRFDEVPPLVSSAVYLDDRIVHTVGGWTLGAQGGVRLDALHGGSTWASSLRDRLLQPRLQFEVAPSARFRVRAGAGSLVKVPTLAALFPDRQYYDLVNFNWYANESAERRAILTTRILERGNPALKMARAAKTEAGIEIDLPRASQIGLVAYSDKINSGVGIRLEPTFLPRDHFAVDSATIGGGMPPRVHEPAARTDTVPVLIDRPDNTLDLESRGLELTAMLPEIVPLRTRVSLQAAWSWSRLHSTGPDFGVHFDEFQVKENDARAPYWENVVQNGERLLVTTRVIHHQPAIGLVVTATTQLFLREVRVNEGSVDTLSFAGYINRRGELMPVAPENRSAAEFEDLRRPRTGVLDEPQLGPVDWLFNLQASKSLPLDGRLSFYAFNAFDRLGTFSGRTTVARAFPSVRFGVELTMPLGFGAAAR